MGLSWVYPPEATVQPRALQQTQSSGLNRYSQKHIRIPKTAHGTDCSHNPCHDLLFSSYLTPFLRGFCDPAFPGLYACQVCGCRADTNLGLKIFNFQSSAINSITLFALFSMGGPTTFPSRVATLRPSSFAFFAVSNTALACIVSSSEG